MFRLRLCALMKRRKTSAYALSRGAGLSYLSAYRLSRPGRVFGRLHAKTLDDPCRFFKVHPSELIEWIP